MFRLGTNTFLAKLRDGICARKVIPLGVLFFLLAPALSFGQTRRLVAIQCDGLPYDLVDRFVKERDPRTGKSQLPWFDYIFYQRGTRLANFYVRGMSLSGPSWSLLDTVIATRCKPTTTLILYPST